MIINFLNEVRYLNLIDIGCSGSLDSKWDIVSKYLNVIGFDPDKKECERLASLPHSFYSVKYLPYAISGENKQETLYKTRNIFCWSLLKPNIEWLKRFWYSDFFEIIDFEQIRTTNLESVDKIRNFDVDIIKIDTQGLELPILSKADSLLDKTFYVETETGFLENYIGETTFSQIDTFMRNKDFLLFDIFSEHRIARKNIFQNNCKGEQILWCEAIWLKDYIALYKKGKFTSEDINRNKALKILILCAVQGCISYGLELAELFKKLSLISENELDSLKIQENWRLREFESILQRSRFEKCVNCFFRLFPTKVRSFIRKEAEIAEKQKSIFSSKL